MSLRDRWDERARDWAAFARTPGHDIYHEQVNFPPFLDLLPPPGRRTLDLGCGEGRVGAELVRRGHELVGVDSSPRMVELARERHEAAVADAAGLPFQDAAFDLVVAYMSLMNMDDIDAAVQEAARVLERGGRFCFATLHPVFVTGDWAEPGVEDSPLVIERYFDAPTKVWESDRAGIRMVFHDRRIPLGTYTHALERAGLLIESMREIPSRRHPRFPLFLHVRTVKP